MKICWKTLIVVWIVLFMTAIINHILSNWFTIPKCEWLLRTNKAMLCDKRE